MQHHFKNSPLDFDPEYNPFLLITGLLAIVGGMLITSLGVLLWMVWVC